MAIIGFIACVAVMLYLSVFGALVVMNTTGRWNIGGASNSMVMRISGALFALVILYLWWVLFQHAPFTIVFN